jgi:hypothetical protein
MPYHKKKSLKKKKSNRKTMRKSKIKTKYLKLSKGGFVRDGSVQQFVLQYCL